MVMHVIKTIKPKRGPTCTIPLLYSAHMRRLESGDHSISCTGSRQVCMCCISSVQESLTTTRCWEEEARNWPSGEKRTRWRLDWKLSEKFIFLCFYFQDFSAKFLICNHSHAYFGFIPRKGVAHSLLPILGGAKILVDSLPFFACFYGAENSTNETQNSLLVCNQCQHHPCGG